ncbi:hypothetical protein CK203_093890 [Vitis vinifera]|uniref:Uncharacterized protein n=1 Tax=Vitis vinifera TaxID=29760 RepID=A0A438C7D4_VITVI|nr:hypothetical protein CK203_093890 [Vitis vinifera]
MPCEAPMSGWRFPSHEYPLMFISYPLRAIVLQVEEMTYIIKRAFMRFNYPFFTAITLGFSPSNFGPSTQTIRAYDGTQRAVIGTLTTTCYDRIHEVGVIPSSLHQKVKFIHEERNITIQSDRDIVTSFEPVLQISHNEDDLHLTRFTFDEVQVVNLEDDSRDMGPREFAFTFDHDIPYGLGYTPTEDDARHMVRLRQDRVRAHLFGVPFDYPLRPYTFQLADYFTRGSEYVPTQRDLTMFRGWLRFRAFNKP